LEEANGDEEKGEEEENGEPDSEEQEVGVLLAAVVTLLSEVEVGVWLGVETNEEKEDGEEEKEEEPADEEADEEETESKPRRTMALLLLLRAWPATTVSAAVSAAGG